MDLEFSPEQEELRSAVRDFLAKECPISLVRAVVERGASTEPLWTSMVGLDWPVLALPEECGGMGLGFAELAVVADELGGSLAPVPFLATTTQFAAAVLEAGSPEQHRRFLTPLAGGSTGAMAHSDDARSWALVPPACRASRIGGGWVLAGVKQAVMGGVALDEMVVTARVEGADREGVGLFVVPAASVEMRETSGIDPTRPLATVVLDGVEVAEDRVLGDPGSPALRRAARRCLDQATTALAVETVGACRALLAIVLDHAKERRQFGVPIGTFQAVKHKLADLQVILQRADSLCRYAVAAIVEDHPDRSCASSMAKAAADDCQRAVGGTGIQILGGIGFTWEHDAHFFVKRAASSSALFGNASEHRLQIARTMGAVRVNA